MSTIRRVILDAIPCAVAEDRRGAVAIEYAVAIGMLGLAIVTAFTGLMGKLIALMLGLPI